MEKSGEHSIAFQDNWGDHKDPKRCSDSIASKMHKKIAGRQFVGTMLFKNLMNLFDFLGGELAWTLRGNIRLTRSCAQSTDVDGTRGHNTPQHTSNHCLLESTFNALYECLSTECPC